LQAILDNPLVEKWLAYHYFRPEDEAYLMSTSNDAPNSADAFDKTSYRNVVTIDVVQDFRKRHKAYLRHHVFHKDVRKNAEKTIARLFKVPRPSPNMVYIFLLEVTSTNDASVSFKRTKYLSVVKAMVTN
jgi:hypothetical protein